MMAPETLLLFALLALLAETLGTVGGFGSSMLFVPIAGFFFDFHSVLGITALFHLASNLSKIVLFRRGFDWRLIRNIGIPSVLCVILGAWLTKYFDSTVLEIILAIFLIVLSLVFILFKTYSVKPTLPNSLAGGALSGLAAGLVGTGGAIRGLTLAAFKLQKDIFIATSAAIDLGIDLSRSVVYWANGYVHRHDLYLIPILIGIGFLGTWLGKRLLSRFTEDQFRYLVLALILGVGAFTLVKQLT